MADVTIPFWRRWLWRLLGAFSATRRQFTLLELELREQVANAAIEEQRLRVELRDLKTDLANKTAELVTRQLEVDLLSKVVARNQARIDAEAASFGHLTGAREAAIASQLRQPGM